MTIQVTQSHIDAAKRLVGRPGSFLDKFHDPVTLAIREATSGRRVMTHPLTVEVDGLFYTLSHEAVEFSSNWSQGIIGQPFSFEITR